MSKQEPSPQGNAESRATAEGRYYVQHLTAQVFVVRECASTNGEPGSDDHIVRSFTIAHDAYMYANSMNNK